MWKGGRNVKISVLGKHNAVIRDRCRFSRVCGERISTGVTSGYVYADNRSQPLRAWTEELNETAVSSLGAFWGVEVHFKML